MINKPHRADSVPRPVSTRIPAAGTALPVSRRASSAAFRPPARPTVVHLPAAKMDWRLMHLLHGTCSRRVLACLHLISYYMAKALVVGWPPPSP